MTALNASMVPRLAITMVNDKAYGESRMGPLWITPGAVSIPYSVILHNASSLAMAGSTDVEYTSQERTDGRHGEHSDGCSTGRCGCIRGTRLKVTLTRWTMRE